VSGDIRIQFGNRLRYLRKKKGWTQAEMADLLGLDRSYVGEIEQGKRNPCLLNLEIIANGLQISLPKLFSNMKSASAPKAGRK
jgi:transcriptional regulator with XRE-family HTH domain